MYALIDCNNFYCSCERVFQPELEGKPLVVLSNNDGCCISRSEEAKQLGIAMGTPYFMLEELVKKHNVIIRSSNYTLYDDMSRRVMRTLARFVPQLEIYSIDETFLDLHNLAYTDLLQLGIEARQTVKQNTGIPVCVGIAPTKTLAKMANRYAKKNCKDTGVYWAFNKEQRNRMLAFTQVGNVWGIGPQYAAMLENNGFKTAADLLNAPEDFIRKTMTVVGQRLFNELKGIPAIGWETEPQPKKNICTSRSFGKLQQDKEIVQQAVANHAASCAEKLRREKSAAGVVHVFVNTNIHRSQDDQYYHTIDVKLPQAANDTPAIVKAAMKGLDNIWRQGFNYKKAGVIVQDLKPHDVVQYALFEPDNKLKLSTAMAALDGINKHYGKNTVRVATQGYSDVYKLRREHMSQRFTTCIDEVVTIKN